MSEMLNELVVINDLVQVLNPLAADEQRRVINWLADYFGIYDDEFAFDGASLVEVADLDEADDGEAVDAADAEPAADTFETFLARVNPKTAIQKIVTSAYWLETKEGKDSWTSFQANKLLKSLDIKISSVSGTLAIEGKKDNPMVSVLDKSGDSMQSRKTFRLSDAGLAFVESRLS